VNLCLLCGMNWHERYKAMKKGMGYTNRDIARIIGNTEDSVKSTTQPNKEIPRWLKLAIVIYEKLK
jgi:predicted transcriptional regulator